MRIGLKRNYSRKKSHESPVLGLEFIETKIV